MPRVPEASECNSCFYGRYWRVQGRIAATLKLKQGLSINMATLDEALFPIVGVLNFTIEVTQSVNLDQLHICLQVCDGDEERIAREVVAILMRTEPVASLFRNRVLAMGSITFNSAGWFTTGIGKRQIKDNR